MGFHGEILVGRGESETFVEALAQFWNWDEEVSDDWQLRDNWRAVCVRTPAADGELAELAHAAGGPVLACLVFEGDMGHIQGISAAGRWEAWLNSDYAAHLRAWSTVDEEVGGLDPDGSPADHARVNQLEAEYHGEMEAARPDAARAAAAWADQAGLLADASRVEEVLFMPWKPQAQRGFFALLAVLGIADPQSES
ncbi:hypothetical protein Caci_4313 [Catenulispora acidiphila DSM 44928]|uniref:Uncharacterized protein n=1 Tax=Catenulispora acidiphila (strain DSM 44928 / JCM 14897 / NBRC 102108 / NRRL B-24433 / ID139908) TaxID=479433 RepID=C7QJT9_CATAD|nr:hypothetical protein Caci_4313 [Catenulispora acidiphila DSM 44928]